MNLRLLMIITSKNNEKKYLNMLDKYKVKFNAITYGKGTASSSLLEYFGLNEVVNGVKDRYEFQYDNDIYLTSFISRTN